MKNDRQTFNRFAKAVAAFLATKQWAVLVVGNVRIEARPPRKYNYRLTLDFTGGKKKAARRERTNG